MATPQQDIGFVLLRSRRRTIGFVISDDGLRVTAPSWVTLRQVDEAVVEKSGWILAKLRDWHKRREQLALSQTQWRAGGELLYLGKRIILELGSRERHATLSGDADAPCDGATHCAWPCPRMPRHRASATPRRPGCNSAPASVSAPGWRISCKPAA